MINKIKIQSIISKYYLGGIIENVKWQTKNKKLNIQFISPTQDLVGSTQLSNFNLEDSEIVIYDTSKLNKLLSVTQGDLILKLNKNKNIITKLNISDQQFDVSYALADIIMAPKVAEVDEPTNYEVEIDLNQENITALIKSQNALTQNDEVIIENGLNIADGGNAVLFVFGENNEHSNKITYSIPTKNQFNFKIPFKSVDLREILVANRDLENGKLFINSEGLMKIQFEKDEFKSEYFLIRKPEV